MIALIVALGIFWFVIWLVTLIPKPPVGNQIIIGVAILLTVLYVLQFAGVHTGVSLPALR